MHAYGIHRGCSYCSSCGLTPFNFRRVLYFTFFREYTEDNNRGFFIRFYWCLYHTR